MNAIAMRSTEFRFTSGAVEALKWLALMSMVIDHVNTVYFGRGLEWAVPAGRLAMPIFSVLVAYNLARPNADFAKAMRRLLVVGVIAQPFHTVLFNGAWLPLNVLFTFFVATAAIAEVERGNRLWAAVIFAGGGFLVDYAWPGLMLVTGAYIFFRSRRPSALDALAVLASVSAICLWVGNAWAYAALPLLWLATRYDVAVPRVRWAFWAFYPAHLALLWSLAR